MLCRCSVWRFASSQGQKWSREDERVERARMQSMIYDNAGHIRWRGLCYVAWRNGRKPMMWIALALIAFYGYNKLVLYLSAGAMVRGRTLDRESEAQLRQTGKLKDDRYLVKPTRQLEDPDFLNVPSYAGKGVYKSKLFEANSDASTSDLHAEYKRR